MLRQGRRRAGVRVFAKGHSMNSKISRSALARTLPIVAGLTVFAGSVHGQAPTSVDDKTIVVEAPRNLPPPPERRSYSGAPIVTTTIRIQAFYGDLDLTQPVAKARLMTRIERVAHDECLYLDRLYPLSPDPGCVDRAITSAAPVAQAVIAAAAGK